MWTRTISPFEAAIPAIPPLAWGGIVGTILVAVLHKAAPWAAKRHEHREGARDARLRQADEDIRTRLQEAETVRDLQASEILSLSVANSALAATNDAQVAQIERLEEGRMELRAATVRLSREAEDARAEALAARSDADSLRSELQDCQEERDELEEQLDP